jgi:hypothetical protein
MAPAKNVTSTVGENGLWMAVAAAVLAGQPP